MGKQTKVKTEKGSTAMSFVVWLISLYIISLGLFTDLKDPKLVYPFTAMFILTSCKLCKIEYDITKSIKDLFNN